jgi:hypothetical protein
VVLQDRIPLEELAPSPKITSSARMQHIQAS